MKTEDYNKQIQNIVEGVDILSINSFKILGKREIVKFQNVHYGYAGDLKSFGGNVVCDEKQQKQNLINAVTGCIYGSFYCGIPKGHDTTILPSITEREVFMEELSNANKTEESLDYNWMIYNIDKSGNVFIKKDEELRWLQSKGYQFQNPQQKQAIVNTMVNLIKPKESKVIQPVFYHVFSETLFPQEAELGRFYWHIKPEGARELIHHLSSVLNKYKVPFQFKCLNHPDLYVRTDSAVLYTDKKYVPVIAQLLKPVIQALKPWLKDGVPLFTKALFKGVSYAEDPGKGMSFGMSRSTVIAEALVDAYLNNKDKKSTLKLVQASLNAKGMRIERLHLNNHTVLTPNFPTYE